MPAAFLLAAALGASQAAHAADPKAIAGKWIETLPNGTRVVTEITDTTIESYPIDAAGKTIRPPRPVNVTYRDAGATVAIDFSGGGSMMAKVDSPDAITLEFSDKTEHHLKRYKAG